MGPESPLGQWPHGLSSMLACLACTLGLFNISRFAILSVHFGANFIIQFILMSFILGIPLLTYHLSLGQLLAAGSMDMWRISPLLQGIGIGLLTSQALLGIYSIVGVSWMFVYFRDSFITKQDVYRWAQPYDASLITNFGFNNTVKLEESVSDYFSGVVLQRSNLETPANTPGHLKFQVTFNLAVVWMLVFISLSKGLKSYGKVVFLFSLVPVFGMLVLCSKLLGLTPADARMQIVFPQTDWSEFFLNTKSWCAAITESFYTWGLLGAAAKQIASHNRPKHILHRDTSFITIFTLTVLMLAAFLANTCTQILLANGYFYVPSSFERMSTYGFLHPMKKSIPPSQSSTPVRWMSHIELLAGERILKPGVNAKQVSGYQVLRLATELVPATLAVLGPDKLSPFWSVLFYFVLIMFGIAQQLAIMHCVITGIMAIKAETMKHWETTITFFTCACGFILGLPMATELGIFVVYFLDYCVGGGWWIIALYLFELTAVFMIRGRPYSGETVVATLFAKAGTYLQKWVAPILSFVWNVVLPVILLILCITVFKNGNFRDLFRWNSIPSYDFWPSWSRQIGLLLQLIPLFTIPVIGIIQSCRYLSDGPPDLFDRLQLLYRPPMGRSSGGSVEPTPPPEPTPSPPVSPPTTTEDPPPKYTPPPSYTTATGARIAKMIRQSFRRSIRRLTRTLGVEENREPLPPPPSYATVLVEINRTDIPPEGEPSSSGTSRPSVASILRNSFRRAMRDTVLEGGAGSSSSGLARPSMASLLRSSFRCAINDNVLESSSSQRLVDSAAPINHDSFILSPTDTIKDTQPSQ